MSVIVGRALPDIRDGLKPVHRRILFGMQEMGLAPNRPTRKCAKITGEVMGKYPPARRRRHLRLPGPHGAAVFHALPADRRPGQLRLGRRRPARGHAVHRGAPLPHRHRPAGRYRQGNRRFQTELRRERAGARSPADARAQPAGQRQLRHRRRYGHQHPAAQPHRDHQRHHPPDPASPHASWPRFWRW